MQNLTWLCCSLTTSEGLERCAASWTPHTILFIANHNYLWYGESAIWRPHKTLFVIFVREYVQKKDMLLKKPLAYDWPCKMIFGRDALGHRKKSWRNPEYYPSSITLSQSLPVASLYLSVSLPVDWLDLGRSSSSVWIAAVPAGWTDPSQYNQHQDDQDDHKTDLSQYNTTW